MKLIKEIINDYKWMVEDYKQWDRKTRVVFNSALFGCIAMMIFLLGTAINHSVFELNEYYYIDSAKVEAEMVLQNKKEVAVEFYRTGLDR